jgi:ABC-type transport system involved in multi-copper enzyme maturation permease subunit
MTLFPIVERELRVAARRAWVYWLRVAVAGLVLGVWLLLLLAAGGNWSPQALGRALFNGVSIPAFVLALFTGVFLTADCISSECREGTLGLLFLTDLRGHDIALGKLATTSLHAGSGLLAIVPMLALTVLLVGVTGTAVVTRALTVLLAALLSLTVGLLCSTLFAEGRKAVLATLATLMVVVGLPMLTTFVAERSGVSQASRSVMASFSPVSIFIATAQIGGSGTRPWTLFWLGSGGQLLLSLACTAVAGWQLPRLAAPEQTAPSAPPARRRPRRWTDEMLHPFWQAGQDHGSGRMLMGLLWLGWAAWFGLSLHALIRDDSDTFGLSLIPAFALHLLFKCQFAAEAARRFAEDRASGALEMLSVTPLSPRRILEQTRLALQQRFQTARWLVLSVNAVIAVFFLAGDGFNAPGGDWPLILILMVGAGVLLFLDGQALAWTGMLEGMRGRKPLRAALGAVGRVLVPAWAGIFLYLFLGFSGLLDDDTITKSLLVFWFGGSAVLDFTLISRARALLGRHFRELAAGESVPARPPTKLGRGSPGHWL